MYYLIVTLGDQRHIGLYVYDPTTVPCTTFAATFYFGFSSPICISNINIIYPILGNLSLTKMVQNGLSLIFSARRGAPAQSSLLDHRTHRTEAKGRGNKS